jgi:hypothetical protein
MCIIALYLFLFILFNQYVSIFIIIWLKKKLILIKKVIEHNKIYCLCSEKNILIYTMSLNFLIFIFSYCYSFFFYCHKYFLIYLIRCMYKYLLEKKKTNP